MGSVLGDVWASQQALSITKGPVALHAGMAARISTFAEGSIKRAREPAPWPPRRPKPWDPA
ncbi:hypothetical protein TGAMA5MH_05741 [Trichoderma gamsii]|uniref:Uncharacterized protein n=1 Tax=Trichoderma gamsii TaxID=398673 RepID=A0A2K0TBU1_9HYPO|nr:hypothetical protein TGAMA5MH_05741 [Trichoderma gamsii]